MAQVFINDSSRRTLQISEEEMQKRWDRDVGPRAPMICGKCKQPPYNGRLYNGLCRKCYNETRAPLRKTSPAVQVK